MKKYTQKLLITTLMLSVMAPLCINFAAQAQTLAPLTDSATPAITPIAWNYLPLIFKQYPVPQPTPTLLPGQPSPTPIAYPSPVDPYPSPNPTPAGPAITYLPVVMSNHSPSLLSMYVPLYLAEY